jgi:hypothetical protein
MLQPQQTNGIAHFITKVKTIHPYTQWQPWTHLTTNPTLQTPTQRQAVNPSL